MSASRRDVSSNKILEEKTKRFQDTLLFKNYGSEGSSESVIDSDLSVNCNDDRPSVRTMEGRTFENDSNGFHRFNEEVEASESCESCRVSRCRGGVDVPEGSSYLNKCTCGCTICMLKTSTLESSACEHDYVQEVCGDLSPSSEIDELCRVTRLRESLERLKNRNHLLKKLLRSCVCRPAILADKSTIGQEPFRQATNDLIANVRILQDKCRTKDGMILSLADELRRDANVGKIRRVLTNLTDPRLCERADDFDRSTLWRFLSEWTTKTSLPNELRSLRRSWRKEVVLGTALFILIVVPLLYRLYSSFCHQINSTFGALARPVFPRLREFGGLYDPSSSPS